MKYKYIMLKTSWGIVVLMNMEALLNSSPAPDDILITPNLHLRIAPSITYQRDQIIFYFTKALQFVATDLASKNPGQSVCLHLNSIDFTDFDFQEEGLYGAIMGWLKEYFQLASADIEVTYDNTLQRYIYPIPADQ